MFNTRKLLCKKYRRGLLVVSKNYAGDIASDDMDITSNHINIISMYNYAYNVLHENSYEVQFDYSFFPVIKNISGNTKYLAHE